MVDALRGVAALSVVWYHFTSGVDDALPMWLKMSGAEGRLGLFVFFVISGFIIPHALAAADFQLRDFGRFMLKRVLRLDPPYAVVVLLCLGLLQFSGVRHEFSWKQFLAHFGYANAFLHYAWYNRVFWTLAIEFQWYLFAALLFPSWRRIGGMGCWLWAGIFLSLAWALDISTTALAYLPLFLLGLAVFWQRTGRLATKPMLLLLVLAGAYCEWRLEPGAGLAGVAAAVLIFSGRDGARWLKTVGTLSYSLYLVHLPIGLPVLRALDSHTDGALGLLFVRVTALTVSLAVAWLLWRFVELPAMRWAARVPLKARAVPISNSRPPVSRN
jgi:peptidoglycan/LPS O-acetylase OafA/YrhL